MLRFALKGNSLWRMLEVFKTSPSSLYFAVDKGDVDEDRNEDEDEKSNKNVTARQQNGAAGLCPC